MCVCITLISFTRFLEVSYKILYVISLIFSEPVKSCDANASSKTQLIANNGTEDITPTVDFSTTTELTPVKLRMHQGIHEDDDHNTHICTTEPAFDDMERKVSASSHNSKNQQHEKTHCNLFKLLILCWSWFCGLEHDNKDHSEYHPVAIENGNLTEKRRSLAIYIKQRPVIKWFLNVNLVIILLVEITLFTVFSIPAKYTFLKE